MELENIVSFKAVNANGEETVVTVDEMTELVAGKINARTSEISTFASTASAGNDEFEDQLPVMSNANWVRGLDANGSPIRVLMKDLATVVGGLLANTYTDYTLEVGVYKKIASGTGLYYISEQIYDGLSTVIAVDYRNAFYFGAIGGLEFKVTESNLYATSNAVEHIRVRKLAQK